MQYKIIRSEEFTTNIWSGGTTTQLYIFPENAEYSKRNFDFRISTANVLSEKSVFTSLPGISRKLMILEGEIEIFHENKYKKQLSKFETDEFSGDWKTSSVGLCIDFNLMTKGKVTGNIIAETLEENQIFQIKSNKKSFMIFVYILSGKIEIENHELNKSDFLVIEEIENSDLKFQSKQKSEFIITEISI